MTTYKSKELYRSIMIEGAKSYGTIFGLISPLNNAIMEWNGKLALIAIRAWVFFFTPHELKPERWIIAAGRWSFSVCRFLIQELPCSTQWSILLYPHDGTIRKRSWPWRSSTKTNAAYKTRNHRTMRILLLQASAESPGPGITRCATLGTPETACTVIEARRRSGVGSRRTCRRLGQATSRAERATGGSAILSVPGGSMPLVTR